MTEQHLDVDDRPLVHCKAMGKFGPERSPARVAGRSAETGCPIKVMEPLGQGIGRHCGWPPSPLAGRDGNIAGRGMLFEELS